VTESESGESVELQCNLGFVLQEFTLISFKIATSWDRKTSWTLATEVRERDTGRILKC